jgi:hypothetical protein
MDIHIFGEGAAERAEVCCRSIFGEDYSRGYARPSPPVLEQIKNDWPTHADDVISVALEAPPGAPINAFKIEKMHRCSVVAGGKLIGYALRMSDQDIRTLDGYTNAWATWRKAQH